MSMLAHAYFKTSYVNTWKQDDHKTENGVSESSRSFRSSLFRPPAFLKAKKDKQKSDKVKDEGSKSNKGEKAKDEEAKLQSAAQERRKLSGTSIGLNRKPVQRSNKDEKDEEAKFRSAAQERRKLSGPSIELNRKPVPGSTLQAVNLRTKDTVIAKSSRSSLLRAPAVFRGHRGHGASLPASEADDGPIYWTPPGQEPEEEPEEEEESADITEGTSVTDQKPTRGVLRRKSKYDTSDVTDENTTSSSGDDSVNDTNPGDAQTESDVRSVRFSGKVTLYLMDDLGYFGTATRDLVTEPRDNREFFSRWMESVHPGRPNPFARSLLENPPVNNSNDVKGNSDDNDDVKNSYDVKGNSDDNDDVNNSSNATEDGSGDEVRDKIHDVTTVGVNKDKACNTKDDVTNILHGNQSQRNHDDDEQNESDNVGSLMTCKDDVITTSGLTSTLHA